MSSAGQSQTLAHVIRVVAENGFGRRLFFMAPQDVDGPTVMRMVAAEAERLGAETPDLSELSRLVQAIAEEHGLRRMAH